MSAGIIFNSSARNVLATLGLAAAMVFSPLKDAFGQKIGDTFTVPQLKETVYQGKNQAPILAFRQVQISTESTPGNPIFVTTERLITASTDGRSGYALKGNGADLRSSTAYTVDDSFSDGMWVFENITSVAQLPKLNISPIAQEKRVKGAAQLFKNGYSLSILGASSDGSYNEYFTRADKEGGVVRAVKVGGDKVELIESADQYLLLPGFQNLKKSSNTIAIVAKHSTSGSLARNSLD